MKRQGAFSETNGSTKPLPLMQQQDFGTNYYAGRASSLSAEGAPLRKSAKVEWLWQLERETTSPALSQIPCPDEVLGRQNGANGNRSYNPFQPSVLLHHLKEEEEASKDQEPNPPLQSHHELDMEIGYEDNLPMSTLESIDHNFSDELKQLDKQQKDAEDAENTRHLERIIEISKEYREKRLSLRAQQVEQRRQFLDREAEEQMQHYHYKQQQLPAMTMPRSSPLHPIAGSIMGFHPDQDAKERAYYSYHPPSSSTMTPLHPHPHPHHHRPHHDSGVNELLHRDGYPQQLPVSRTEPQTKVMEGRVPLPAGRVYNNTTAAAGRYH